MSIQTTRYITRDEAEQQLLEKEFKERSLGFLNAYIKSLSDTELEEKLDEQFYNYTITS